MMRGVLLPVALAVVAASAEPTLYERLGKLEKIKPLVHSIYLKHKLDPISAEWFKGKDDALIEKRVVEFFAAGTGAPDVEYTGRDLLELHTDMKISGEAFLAIQDHVMTSLDEHGYDKVLKDEVLGILYSLKPQIIPNHKPITGKDIPVEIPTGWEHVQDGTLYERLGKLEKIKPLVHSVYLKHKLDPISAEWFKGWDDALIEKRVVEFFAAGTGATDVKYTGRDLLELHTDMKISGDAFLAIQDHVMTSLEEFGYGKALRDEVLGILFSLKPQILPNHKPITGKDLPAEDPAGGEL